MSRHLLGGLLLLTGVILLLFSNNLLPWALLFSLLSLWPLVLIAWGINLLLSNTFLRGSGTLLLILLMVGIVGTALLAKTTFDEGRSHDFGAVVSIDQNRIVIGAMQLWYGEKQDGLVEATRHDWPQEAERYRATLSFRAGSLRLGASEDAGRLLEVHTSSMMPHARPQVQITPGSTTEIDLQGEPMAWVGMHSHRNLWQLGFNAHHPAEFDIRTGAAESQLDFSHIFLENLDLRVGAASSTVRFGSLADKVSATIEQGAAQTTIEVPSGMGVQLNYEGGLSSLQLPRDMRRDNADRSLYVSANFATAAAKLELTVRSGVGSVRIIRYEAKAMQDIPQKTQPVDTGLTFTRIQSGAQAPYQLRPEGVDLIVLNDDETLNDVNFDRPYNPRRRAEDHLVLLLLQGEQSTGGFRIRAERLTREDDTLIVEADFTTPRRSDLVTQGLTSPYDMIAIPFEEIGPIDASLTIILEDVDTRQKVLERLYKKEK